MSAKAVDVLILIPLIPAIPVIATWFLPWERWIPRVVPKKVIGPFLLYGALAAWHFQLPWWEVILVAVWGSVVSGMAISEALRLIHARDWPATEGRISGISRSGGSNGTVKVTVTYTYRVHEELYGGIEELEFTNAEDAQRFENAGRERTVRIHYRPDKPEVSVLGRDDTKIGKIASV